MSLQFTQYLVGGFDNNCTYICTDTATNVCAVIDPAGNIDTVLRNTQNNPPVAAVLLTHTHHDHYDALPAIYNHTGTIPIYVHQNGEEMVRNAGYNTVIPVLDNDVIPIGKSSLQVLHTPGHSSDGVCYYYEGNHNTTPALLSGDTLFVQGCGRTSITNAPQLFTSLKRISRLPKNTRILPGHDYGPTTESTVALELQNNRFMKAADLDAFMNERFPA